MKAAYFLLAALLFASTAVVPLDAMAGENLVIRGWLVSQGPIEGDFVFRMTSEGSDPLEFVYPIPTDTSCIPCESVQITEATAASRGLDWALLEELLAGPAAKTTAWGPLADPAEYSGPLTTIYGPDAYFEDVSLQRVIMSLTPSGFPSRWTTASISVNADFRVVAPEPSTAWLVLLVGLAHTKIRVRR